MEDEVSETNNAERKKTKSGVSRREFIAGTVGGAAALGAMTTLMPSVLAASSIGERATALATPGASQKASAPAQALAPAPTTWDVTADVVVVGTGIAGLAAAIMAHDNGAAVVVLEKETQFFGGNTCMSGGDQQMPNSFIQQAAGIEDHVEWAVEDWLQYGHYRNTLEVLQMAASGGNDTALWEQGLGLVWNKTPSLQGGNRVARSLSPAASPNYPGTAGISEIYVLNQALNSRGITIQMGKKMTQIYRPDLSGPVVGIQVNDLLSGKVLNYQANKAVVLATGGFKSNPQLVRDFHPWINENFIWSGYPYSHTTGDGHIAAVQVGAGYIDCTWPVSFGHNKFGTSVDQVWTPVLLQGDPTKIPLSLTSGLANTTGAWAILVAADGNRFVNEAVWGVADTIQVDTPDMAAYLALPFNPRNVWAVVDSNGAKGLNWSLAKFQTATIPTVAPNLDSAYLAWSNTLAGLADQMAISETALAATVARYNGFAASGTDSDFGRPAPLNAINTPPYLAAKFLMGAHDVTGGIRVNTSMQVLDCQSYPASRSAGPSTAVNSEAVIPHLYGAGEFAGGFWGYARGHGKIGMYCVEGRVAGTNAAKEVSLT